MCIRDSILSYHILKSLFKQKNTASRKFLRIWLWKIIASYFILIFIYFLFQKLAFYMGNMGLKERSIISEENIVFLNIWKGPIFKKIFYHGERPRKMSWGHFCWYFLFIYDLILSIQAKLRYLKDFKFSRVLELKVIFFKFWSFGEEIYIFVFFS